MGAPRIALRAVVDLQPSANNARTHSDSQIAQLVHSLHSFGFTNPILADEQGIVAGHGRALAALAIYADGGTILLPNGQALPEGKVPVIDVSGWDADKRRAYLLADNQIALNAGWDEATLNAEIEALMAVDFNLDSIGFDESALAALADPEPPAARAAGEQKDSGFQHVDQFGVIVMCKDAAEQERVFNRLRDEGLQVKVVVV